MAVDCQVNFVYHRSSWFTPVPFLRDNLSPYWMMAQLTAVLGSINLIQVHLITLMILLWSLSRHWPQSYPAFTGVTMPEFELTCDLYYVRAQLYTVHTFWRHCLVSKSRLHLMWHLLQKPSESRTHLSSYQRHSHGTHQSHVRISILSFWSFLHDSTCQGWRNLPVCASWVLCHMIAVCL